MPTPTPPYKKPIGRPTKKRRRERNEPKVNNNPYKVKITYGATICKNCGQAGHNSRSCQQKKNDMADEEAIVAAEATTAEAAAAEAGHNQQAPQIHGKAAPEVNMPLQPHVNSGARIRSNPMVSVETMNAASPSMRRRFMDYMPTPGLTQQPGPGPSPSILNGTTSKGPSVSYPIVKKVQSAKSGKGGGGPSTTRRVGAA
ncbi:hypothetical protein PIB30_058183 [Stylosanthes scabra]|uniref:CCHC-type domain-containing protein n=1 Tax=Stylosanthes scabra TaxID=79078 RepID=A0ABU6VN07_9FABA|nr:hypothetical protein [Stylosanthes scabra]